MTAAGTHPLLLLCCVCACSNVALQLKSNVAALVNKAGLVVQPSVSSITFAAVELGTATRSRLTAAMDLTDGTGSSVWPITMMSFLLIDTALSRSTCHVRAASVQFWQWFYGSEIAVALLATRGYAPVPSIVLTQLDVAEQLANDIMCRGAVAVSTASTSTRLIGAPVAISFLSTLFANLYASQDNSVAWQVLSNPDQLILQQLVDSEVDIAFINPSNVDPAFMQQVLDDTDFLILPAYLTAVVYGVNPSLTSSISIAGRPLTLDWPTILQIAYGCILHWNDAVILAQNPWLAALLPPLNTTPILITKVVGCGNSYTTAPLAIAMSGAFTAALAAAPDSATYTCLASLGTLLANAFSSCTSIASLGFLFVPNEATVPGLVLGINGALGIIQNTGDSSTLILAVNESRAGGESQVVGNVTGETACVQGLVDGFEQGGLTSLLPLAGVVGDVAGGCYRGTEQVWVVVRSNYSGAASDASGCTRGYDTLRFLQWWYGTTAIDTLVQSVQSVRVSSLSASIVAAITGALNDVTCGQETLLVTHPVEWSLGAGVQTFVYLISSLGLAACVALLGFVVYYRHHPVIRSASPLFLLLSIFGLIVLFAAGFFLVTPVTVASCAAFSWFINIGLMLTFSPLFAKTWRIYRIFGRRKLTVVALSNKKLLLMVAALMGAEVLIMAVWQGLGQLQPIVNDVQTSTPTQSSVPVIASRLEVDEYVQCGVPAGVGQSMFVVVCVEKGLLFVWGALMAFTTRKVSSTFNEAQGITLALYNTCFTVGIIAPIILVIRATGDVLDLLLAFALLWIASFTGAVLFGPKVMTVFSKAAEADTQSATASSSSSNGYAFLSLAALSSIGVLQGYLAALKKHTAQVEDKIARLRNRASGHHAQAETSTTQAPSASPAPQKRSPTMNGRTVSMVGLGRVGGGGESTGTPLLKARARVSMDAGSGGSGRVGGWGVGSEGGSGGVGGVARDEGAVGGETRSPPEPRSPPLLPHTPSQSEGGRHEGQRDPSSRSARA